MSSLRQLSFSLRQLYIPDFRLKSLELSMKPYVQAVPIFDLAIKKVEVIIFTILVVLEYQMQHTKFQGLWLVGSIAKDF